MKPIQIQAVMELVRMEFRRYGFRADGGKSRRAEKTVHCEFDEEAATGQAAFSQYTVVPYCRIWVEAESAELHDVLITDEERISIDLYVSYEHVNGGGNGYSVRYELIRRFSDEIRLRRITN
jgi:hypothetical protein